MLLEVTTNVFDPQNDRSYLDLKTVLSTHSESIVFKSCALNIFQIMPSLFLFYKNKLIL